MANYTARSRHHVSTHGHAANSAPQPGKSRFRIGEGGQKFTDEVILLAGAPVIQAHGNLKYEVVDLGRGVVGYDQYGNWTARGGVVIVAGLHHPTCAPDEVITQYPR